MKQETERMSSTVKSTNGFRVSALMPHILRNTPQKMLLISGKCVYKKNSGPCIKLSQCRFHLRSLYSGRVYITDIRIKRSSGMMHETSFMKIHQMEREAHGNESICLRFVN
jgi:hypothetical protein